MEIFYGKVVGLGISIPPENNFWFAGIFRGYKPETLAKNVLMKSNAATLLLYDKLRRLKNISIGISFKQC